MWWWTFSHDNIVLMADLGSTPAAQAHDDHPILFFDGQCGLCAKSVRWCLNHDRRAVLRFAPLQGQTYAAIANPSKPADLDTAVLAERGELHVRSEAVLRAGMALGGFWGVLATAAQVIPRGLRDVAYRFIAKRRIKWFGNADACAIPTAAERARMLP